MELLIQYVSYSLTNFRWLLSGNKVVRRTIRAFSRIALSHYHLLQRVIKTFFCLLVCFCFAMCLFVHLLVCLFWQWYRADLTLLCHILIQELMSSLRRISTTSYGYGYTRTARRTMFSNWALKVLKFSQHFSSVQLLTTP